MASSNKIDRRSLKYVKDLGEGGYSAVFQMTWNRQEGPIEIAAKKLRKRDVHELEVLSILDHPNIVKLLGVVDEEMEFMLILELCERGSLLSYLDELGGKGLPDQQFYDWAEQGAKPLEYLRRRSLVHKDVKSPNYMVTAAYILKLGDFGLAKNVNATIGNATDRGSHRWMAPELLGKGILSPKYDVFAFAVVLWEMWTGKLPFAGLDWQVIAWKVIKEKERLPIPEDCPEPIKNLMKQCWEEDWNQRPTIQEVINVIGSAASAFKEEQMMTIVGGRWKLESRIGYQDGSGKLLRPRGIVVNSSNTDIAICDLLVQQVKVYTFGTGEYKFSMDTTHGLDPGIISFPWQIAINSQCTMYFVTDWTKLVKCYDANGKFKCCWASSCPQASSSPSLTGLAIDPDGSVHVGDHGNECINTHRTDGSYIRCIKVGLHPLYIAVTSHDTIVVADWNKPPQIVSKSGDLLHTLKHPVDESQWDPWGVCCFRDVILIANNYIESNTIFGYSNGGKYIGDMGTHIPHVFPRGIAMTRDGRKMMVSDRVAEEVRVYSI